MCGDKSHRCEERLRKVQHCLDLPFRDVHGPSAVFQTNTTEDSDLAAGAQKRPGTSAGDSEDLMFNKLHVQEGRQKKHRKLSKQQLLKQAESKQAAADEGTVRLLGQPVIASCMVPPVVDRVHRRVYEAAWTPLPLQPLALSSVYIRAV
jgi:hypothetical protein